TKIDFAIEKRETPALANTPERKPLGAAGKPSAPSLPQTRPDRREARDRWRVGFPEYDRYGDKAGRGRDIQFNKGHSYDPYHQSKIKGDYPIVGQKTFMILSAVDSIGIELRRAPTPSDVSSVSPGSAEFFGRPEALAVNHTMQFTFELFHGD